MRVMNTNNIIDITGFLSHFMIEFYYGIPHGRYVREPLFHYGLIIEKYGVFDECWPMTESILNFINTNTWKPGESKLLYLPHCSITKCVQIDIDNETKDLVAGYDYIDSIYDEINEIFDKIIIVISYNVLNDIKKSEIMHELQHAKEDLELRKKGFSSKLKAIQYGLKKLLDYESKDGLEQTLQLALYYLTSFEQSAYINSIHTEIEELKKNKFHSPKEIYDHITKYGFYKRYLNTFEFCESVLLEKDPVVQKQILDITNNMSNNNFQNWHQFKHWLKNKVVSFKKKFNKIIPKIIYEDLENNIMTGFATTPMNYPEKYTIFLENNNIKLK